MHNMNIDNINKYDLEQNEVQEIVESIVSNYYLQINSKELQEEMKDKIQKAIDHYCISKIRDNKINQILNEEDLTLKPSYTNILVDNKQVIIK